MIEDEKVPKDMLDLAVHIVETKAGRFAPEKFEDEYETALKELLRKKGRADRTAQGAVAHQCGQSHGCTAPEHQGGRPRLTSQAESFGVARRQDCKEAIALSSQTAEGELGAPLCARWPIAPAL